MLVVNRFRIGVDEADDFAEQAGKALEALAARPGYLWGQVGRAYDDPSFWTLTTEWESVGAYRRALGGFEVKVHATPLLAQSVDEPSAYETLMTTGEDGALRRSESDRAGGAGDALRSRS